MKKLIFLSVLIFLMQNVLFCQDDSEVDHDLLNAITNNDTLFVKERLDSGFESENMPHMALHHAIKENQLDIIILLLNFGINVNYDWGIDGTPLTCAARQGNLRIMQLLVENGADINLQANYEGLPLLLVILGGHTDIFRYFLEKGGVDINKRQRMGGGMPGGWTYLSAAAYQGNIEIVKMLLMHGASKNTEFMNDALSQAIRGKHPEIIALLEQKGARKKPRMAADDF
jgi:ankyrin repeat protein